MNSTGKFNLEKIVGRFQAEGIHVIPAFTTGDNISLVFTGNLEEFVLTVKALEAKSVLAEEFELEESDFFEDWEDDVYGSYENISQEETSKRIYLPNFLPKLEQYKRHIGEIHYVKILVPYNSQFLIYLHKTQLYIELEVLREQALEEFEVLEEEAKRNYEREVIRKSEEKAQIHNGLKKKLDSLLNDGRFSKLGTQRAMQAYALELFPELGRMDAFDLKNEIQTLNDRIKARKVLAD